MIYAYFILVFVTGGNAQLHGWVDALVQLLGLPILGFGLWRLAGQSGSRTRTLGLVAMAAVAGLPWLQLLPLPQAWWLWAPARQSLAQDLAAAGVHDYATTWSLTPATTLRSALLLLPALALFAWVLGSDTRTQRRLLAWCVALPIASLFLGFLQQSDPQSSLLHFYPEWAGVMWGTFINHNHQATAMLAGLGVCLSFTVGAINTQEPAADRTRNPWPPIIAGSILLLCLPLTESRAAVAISAMMLAAAAGMAFVVFRRSGRGRVGPLALAVAAALAVLGVSAAIGWMKVDEVDEIRWIMRHAAFALGILHLPWGSGIGSYSPIFLQALPQPLLMPKYMNMAHNDWVQAWLEAGVAGVLVAATCGVALVACALSALRMRAGDSRLIWSGLLGIFAILVHSIVDYPLRTPAMVSVTALLAAILVAQCSRQAGPRR